MQCEGLLRETRVRQAYDKPSERRVRERAQAIARRRKAPRKKMQREGLLPAASRRASAR
ncbi:30S ribosomal protein S21 [Rhizobium cauense]|uniref:30S ribosomal protein S21 n=1 Tax=Rhizobium cauense TaxID=1166683 RepID=UPI001C6E45A9|nr:30S ribosomal protein S21 [Rhizobium cauense]